MPDASQGAFPAILIPGFEPSGVCVSLASALAERGFPVVALCRKGGAEAVKAASACGCEALEAAAGEELRAGLAYIKANRAELPGAIWLEWEQGYTPADVLAVSYVSAVNPGSIVLASRAQCRSGGRFARFAARLAFLVFHQRNVRDAWSGLLYLPASRIGEFLQEKGAGDAYRFRLLLTMQRRGVAAVDVPVSAASGGERRAAEKSRALDILRIALVPLMFVASSLALTGADYFMRFLFYYVILRGNEPVSLAVGFYTGAFVGYLINRNVVFRNKNGGIFKEFGTIVKYAVLTTCNYYLAHLLISFFMSAPHLAFPLASVIASVLLYAPNFLAQRELVFRRVRKQYA